VKKISFHVEVRILPVPSSERYLKPFVHRCPLEIWIRDCQLTTVE